MAVGRGGQCIKPVALVYFCVHSTDESGYSVKSGQYNTLLHDSCDKLKKMQNIQVNPSYMNL